MDWSHQTVSEHIARKRWLARPVSPLRIVQSHARDRLWRVKMETCGNLYLLVRKVLSDGWEHKHLLI
jgi:hypothetical protein